MDANDPLHMKCLDAFSKENASHHKTLWQFHVIAEFDYSFLEDPSFSLVQLFKQLLLTLLQYNSFGKKQLNANAANAIFNKLPK